LLFHNSKGVAEDAVEAVKWRRKVSEQGNPHHFQIIMSDQPGNSGGALVDSQVELQDVLDGVFCRLIGLFR
jgi:hypothetical protein